MRTIAMAAAAFTALLASPGFAQTAGPQPSAVPDLVLRPLGGLVPPPPQHSSPNRGLSRGVGAMMPGASDSREGPMPSKGAEFSLRRGPTDIRIRCGENEPVRSCADAALMLMDKFSAMTPQMPPQPPSPPDEAPVPPAPEPSAVEPGE